MLCVIGWILPRRPLPGRSLMLALSKPRSKARRRVKGRPSRGRQVVYHVASRKCLLPRSTSSGWSARKYGPGCRGLTVLHSHMLMLRGGDVFLIFSANWKFWFKLVCFPFRTLFPNVEVQLKIGNDESESKYSDFRRFIFQCFWQKKVLLLSMERNRWASVWPPPTTAPSFT